MKKIINQPDQIVLEMVQGIVDTHPNHLRQLPHTTVIVRKDAPIPKKVGLVSGGGSGHEPAHAGYVGEGMLDAAVVGEVFTSPTPDQILAAIKAVDSDAGVLLIIKNYTGDVLNFEMAAELAQSEGIIVDKVIVNDDVAVEDSSFTTGRRGIAGTVYVHKISGAKARQGGTLEEVKGVAEKVIANVRSMGMAISPCSLPSTGEPSFTLADDEIEVGIGIHGEPGIERRKIMTADEIASVLTHKVLADIQWQENDEAAVMINGLGSTPEMELYILSNKVREILSSKGIQIHSVHVGEYMTALEMGGVSVTLLKLDEELKTLLDDRSDAPSFKV